jgi:hypothetical protein
MIIRDNTWCQHLLPLLAAGLGDLPANRWLRIAYYVLLVALLITFCTFYLLQGSATYTPIIDEWSAGSWRGAWKEWGVWKEYLTRVDIEYLTRVDMVRDACGAWRKFGSVVHVWLKYTSFEMLAEREKYLTGRQYLTRVYIVRDACGAWKIFGSVVHVWLGCTSFEMLAEREKYLTGRQYSFIFDQGVYRWRCSRGGALWWGAWKMSAIVRSKLTTTTTVTSCSRYA